MAKFSVIPKSGGSPKCSGTPSFTGTYMKPGMLEFREVASPYPIAWEIGDYVAYSRTGLTYRLYSIPQLKKQARNQSYGGAYIYQGVQFYDDSKQLEICPFRDLVAGDNRIHFSTQPSISTFEAVDGIARRLQVCLDDMYPDTWLVRLATAQMGAPQDLLDLMAEPRDFTVSGVSLLGALEKVYEVWPEVGWVFTREQVTVGGATVWRNVLTIGGGGLSSTQSYLYGKGNGLKSITRTVANADEFANRIFSYGSQRNMLPRWYNDMLIKDADSVDIQNLMLPVAAIPSLRWNGWGLTEVDGAMLPDAAKAYVEDGDSVLRLGLRPKSIYFDGSGEYPEIYPTIRNMTIGEIRTLINERVVSPEWVPSPSYDNTDRIDMVLSVPTVFDPGLSGENGRAAAVSASETLGSLSGSGNVAAGGNANAVLAMRTYTMTKTCPTDLSVSVAGNGTVTLQGAGYAHLAVSIQKGDGATFAEVKRQMFELEESASGVFQLRSVIVKAPDVSVSNGEIVRIYVSLFITNTDGSASLSYSYAVSPGLNFAAAWSRKKTFTITIRQCGFDIGAQAALGDGKTISMRTGKCAGRSFAINSVQYDADTDSWVLECFRSEDESLSQWFPNTDYPIEADDEFVLLDIAMPELYIIVAERRLLQAARELLADTATERWQYVPEIDAKFMVETGRTIVAGQNMSIADLDIIGENPVSVLVDSLNINEGEAVIPTYKVTLRDRKKKTWTESNPPEPISSKPVSTVTQQSLQVESTSGGGESFFTLDANGNVTLRPQYQNMWVPGWLASGGVGQGSGGGGTDLNRVWESLTNNTDFPNEKINLAHIPDVPYTQVTGLDSWVAGKGYLLPTSLKTVNGNSLVGSGDITIADGQDGKSAYQIWLDEGNTGTEADFLASLKGDTGVSADYPITIYNGLDSSATDQALAALQGKLLDQKIENVMEESSAMLDAIGEPVAAGSTVTGKYVNLSGELVNGSDWLYKDYDVSSFDKVEAIVTINGGSIVSAITGYDSHGNFVKSYATGDEGTATVQRTARIDCAGDGVATLRLCYNSYVSAAPQVNEVINRLDRIEQTEIPAVEDAVNELKADLYAPGESVSPSSTVTGKYINLTGEIVSHSDFVYNEYSVSGLVYAECTINGGSAVSVITGYDSHGNFVKSYAPGDPGTSTVTRSAEINCTEDGVSMLRICSGTFSISTAVLKEVVNRIDRIEDETIPSVEASIESLQNSLYQPGSPITEDDDVDGAYINGSGTPVQNSDFGYKEYDVTGKGVVYAKCTINGGSAVSVITGYNSNGDFVKSYAMGDSGTATVNREAVIDRVKDGVAMVRISTNAGYMSTASLSDAIVGVKSTPVKIQAWGDSITFQAQFKPSLAEELGITVDDIKNCGIGSDFSMHIRRRFVSYFTDQTPYIGTQYASRSSDYTIPSFADRQKELNESFFIFWMGTNNLLNGNGRSAAFTSENADYLSIQPNPQFKFDNLYSQSYEDMILDDIRQMVGILPHGNFIIIGGHGGFMADSPMRDKMLAVDAMLSRMYPHNFVDLRELVLMDYSYLDIKLASAFVKPALNGAVSITLNDASFVGDGKNPSSDICIGTKSIFDRYHVTARSGNTVTATLVESNTEFVQGDTISASYLLVSDLGQDAVSMDTRVYSYEDCTAFSLLSYPRSCTDPIHFTQAEGYRIGQLLASEIKKMKLTPIL